MTTAAAPPKHILAVIPAQRALVVHLCDGVVSEMDKIPNHAEPIGDYLDRLYDQIGDEVVEVVVQSAPWSLNYLNSQQRLHFARGLTETQIRWVAVCELDKTYYVQVGRGRWLTSLSEHPEAVTSRDTGALQLDTVRTAAQRLAVRDSDFADAACLGLWYHRIGFQNPHTADNDEHKPRRAHRRRAAA